MRILIAEDDFTSRMLLSGVLKRSGHEVLETNDGAAAWAAVQLPDAPRLFILDWMMPEMDGAEVVRRIRSLPTDQPPYLILLTNKSDKTDIIAGLEAGANDYLRKPFDPGELHARIEVGRRMVELIASQKQVEEALRIKSAELERFTYMVSHDLKSPLVTIKTFLGFLEKDMEAQQVETVARDLGFIRNAADKMALLLEDLLEFSRVGHKGNAPVEVPLQEIAQEALDLVAGQIANRGVQAEVTQEPAWVFGDRSRLVEVFQNLIDNAVKFMGEQPDPRVEIGIERAGEEAELFVRDNGKGIDPRHHGKVFGLFEKLDTSVPGSGLGLAMVQRIIELHGGTIRVESDGLGRGTTFRFTMAKTRLQPK